MLYREYSHRYTTRAISVPIVLASVSEIKMHTYDISCPADNNIFKKQDNRELTKYSDFLVEVSGIWQYRTLVVALVLGALGTVQTGIEWLLDIIPGHHNLHHLQKIELLVSSRILHN